MIELFNIVKEDLGLLGVRDSDTARNRTNMVGLVSRSDLANLRRK
jgi:hypothetical protein